MNKRSIRLGLLAALGFLVAACGDDDNSMQPTVVSYEPSACAMPIPAGQDPSNVQCGYVTVAEDRDLADGRTVRLAVAVLRATGPSRAEDPIVNLGAGLGPVLDSSMQVFTAAFAAPLQSTRDLVFIDQRGTGRSHPVLDCPELILPQQQFAVDQSVEADAARDVQSLIACHDRLVREGINLAAYTTKSLAADVGDVLHALGYRSWNLYGFSQSTRIAQVLMRDSPAGEIRSVVLDSAIPLAHIHLLDSAANYERLLRLISADCVSDAGCNRMYPDTARLAFDVISQLNAMPLTVRLTDPDTGERLPAVFSGDRFVLTNSLDLQSAGVALVYPALVKSLARRLPTLLLTVDAQLPAMTGSALVYSVICEDQIPFVTPDALAVATQGVHPEIVHAFRAGFHDLDATVCRAWTSSRPAPKPAAPVVSDIPTLILSGQYDPAVPPSLAAEVARTLSRSSILEFRGYGHGELYTFASAGAPNCAARVMGDFFSHPEQPPDASCVAEIPPPRFFGT